MTGLKWIKSSYSNGSSACVQVRPADDAHGGLIGVRNSRTPDGSTLWFTHAEWDAFYKGMLDGEFQWGDHEKRAKEPPRPAALQVCEELIQWQPVAPEQTQPERRHMSIVEFLLARIAEDDAGVNTWGAALAASSDHDLRRLALECDAKSWIIKRHQPVEHDVLPPVCEWCSGDTGLAVDHQWPCKHLKVLALPYASHGDFQTAWRLWPA